MGSAEDGAGAGSMAGGSAAANAPGLWRLGELVVGVAAGRDPEIDGEMLCSAPVSISRISIAAPDSGSILFTAYRPG